MDSNQLSVTSAVLQLQQNLEVPKNKARSLGDIVFAVRLINRDLNLGLVLNFSDNLEVKGECYYVHAVASFTDIATGASVCADGWARECSSGCSAADASHVTGYTSKCARLYALCGLLGIDGAVDISKSRRGKSPVNAESKTVSEKQEPELVEDAEREQLIENTAAAVADYERTKAEDNMMGEVKRLGLSNKKMKEILAKNFNGKTSKQLSTAELQTLVINLESWAAQ